MHIPQLTINYIDYYTPIPWTAGEVRQIVNRPHSGIAFAPGGICHYTQNGVTHTNDNQHVLFLPAGGTYTITCEKDVLCPLINFDSDFTFSEIISCEVADSTEFLQDFVRIAKAWAFNKEEIYYTAMAYLYNILSGVLHPRFQASPGHSRLLENAKEFIMQNYINHALEVEDIARHLNVSTVYFRKIFRDCYGVPPMKYINDMRIRQAKAMLRDQILSVSEIAEYSGFSSVYSFSRTFKLAVGCTPSEYRKRRLAQL